MYLPKDFVIDIAKERYSDYVITPVLMQAQELTNILDFIPPENQNYVYVGVVIGGIEDHIIFAQLDGKDLTVGGAHVVPNQPNLELVSEMYQVNRTEFINCVSIPIMFQYMSTQGVPATFVGYKIQPLN